MAVCMRVAAGHVHGPACERAASGRKAHQGRETTQIGIRVPDDLAVKVRELAGNYDSVNAYINHLLVTQAARPR